MAEKSLPVEVRDSRFPSWEHHRKGRLRNYDANGNLDGVTGNGTDDLAIAWTSYNKPARIDKGSAYSAFAYGPDRARFKHVKQDSAGETQIVTSLGVFERVETIQPDGTTTLHYRQHLAGGADTVAILTTTRIAGTPPTTTEQLDYLLRDHQGSVVGVVDANGNHTQQLDYDAWGKRVNETNLGDYAPGLERYTLLGDLNALPTPRGYTGHEMLDHLGLIHMNGRIYLPEIGRFLSADPFVQFPESTQGYNRYSYVGNNPLSYTDPSGFFSLKGLIFGGILGALNPELAGKIIGVLGPIVSVFCGPAYAACATAAGAVSGYLQTGSLRQAFKSAGMAAVASGIGQGAQLRFGGTTAGAIATRAAIQGVAGGILSEAGGGRFGDGFLGGAAGSLAGNIAPTGGFIGDVIVGAIAGGTVAEIGGGKFANGAISGAMAAAFGNMQRGEQGGIGGGGTKELLRDENGNLVQSDEVAGPFVEGDAVVSSQYGDVRIINGTENLHAGVDFVPMNVDGTVNTNAYAISGTEGTLVSAGVSDTFGNYVLVKTPGGDYVFYAHLNQHASNIPTNINVGTRLGIIGNTGRSTGLHLHVEIRQGSWEVTAPRLSPGRW